MTPETTAAERGEVPAKLRESIVVRSRAGWRPHIEAFAGWLARHGVALDIGRSRRTPDGLNRYVMAHALGPRRFSAALYVHPSTGRVDFHLRPGDLTERDRRCWRVRAQGRGRERVRVTIMLDGPAKLEIAQRLAQRA